MQFKVREFVSIKNLKLIYYAIFIFDCHVNYANTVWGLNRNSINRFIILQKKLSTLQVLNLEMLIQILFLKHEIIKPPGKILMENCLFIIKSVTFNLSSIFNNWFTFSSDLHNYEFSSSSKSLIKVKTVNTKEYSWKDVMYNAISSWNNIQKIISSHVLCGLSYSKLKSLLVKYFLKIYSNNCYVLHYLLIRIHVCWYMQLFCFLFYISVKSNKKQLCS